MYNDQAYAKKPKNLLHRLIVNILFVLPLLFFIAIQIYEYYIARELRAVLEEGAPALTQNIALISYDFFDDSYTLEQLQFIDEQSEVSLNIAKVEIKNLALENLSSDYADDENSILYQSLTVEKLEYYNKNLGIFSLDSYKESKRKASTLKNIKNIINLQDQASLFSLYSLIMCTDFELEKIKYDYISQRGKGEFSLAEAKLNSSMYAEKKYYTLITNSLQIQHKNFVTNKESEFMLDECVYENFQEINVENLTSLYRNENRFLDAYAQEINKENNTELEQKIHASNLSYTIDNINVLAFDALEFVTALPFYFAQLNLKNFTLTQSFYNYYKESTASYIEQDDEYNFEPINFDISLNYTLAQSLKEVTFEADLKNKDVFSAILELNFILPEDLFTVFTNSDYFFGILLAKADFSFIDNGLVWNYLQDIMQTKSMNKEEAKAEIFSKMPQSQFYTEVKKLFEQEGRLDINLESGKVLGISDVYGLLLYPHASDFIINYKKK